MAALRPQNIFTPDRSFTGNATAINTRLGELRKEMATLVKMNLTAGVDTEIYGEEYYRINGRDGGPEE